MNHEARPITYADVLAMRDKLNNPYRQQARIFVAPTWMKEFYTLVEIETMMKEACWGTHMWFDEFVWGEPLLENYEKGLDNT